MNVAVLAVGTELLLGQIVDTNSAWLGSELAAGGIDSLVQVKVGDNPARIEAQLRRLLNPSDDAADAVIVCGGLGPTHDDVTRDVIASVMGSKLRLDESAADVIGAMFESRELRMPENNLRQAMIPEGATVIPQSHGTAPGLIAPVHIQDLVTGEQVLKVVYALPGVPHEMYDMFHRAVLPDLLRRHGQQKIIQSRVLRTWGESESGLNERLNRVIEELDHLGTPTLAFLASGWEGLKIRLTAKAVSPTEAQAILDRWEFRIRDELKDLVFGVENDTMESVILDRCHRLGWSLAVAESVTGGLVGGRLTAVSGSSEVFVGGVTSYATSIKRSLLGVGEGPVVSENAALEMAAGIKRVAGADVGLSLTGVAGPDEQDGQPIGTLIVGLVTPIKSEVHRVRVPGQREQMRQLSVITALGMLRRALPDPPDR